MLLDGPPLSRALHLAVTAHDGQHRKKARKDAPDPYVVHPLRVLARVHAWGLARDEEALAAAALHDVVEDTSLTLGDVEREFGTRVAGLVDALTHPEDLRPRERTRVILDKLADAPLEALLIKLADRLDNVLDMPDWRAKSRRGYLEESVTFAERARARLRHAEGSERAENGATVDALRNALDEYEPLVRARLADVEREIADAPRSRGR